MTGENIATLQVSVGVKLIHTFRWHIHQFILFLHINKVNFDVKNNISKIT